MKYDKIEVKISDENGINLLDIHLNKNSDNTLSIKKILDFINDAKSDKPYEINIVHFNKVKFTDENGSKKEAFLPEERLLQIFTMGL
jgi:hypothetical protein